MKANKDMKLSYCFYNYYVKHELRVYDHTAVRWARECREMCIELCMVNGVPIGGEGIEVEIDETKIGE